MQQRPLGVQIQRDVDEVQVAGSLTVAEQAAFQAFTDRVESSSPTIPKPLENDGDFNRQYVDTAPNCAFTFAPA